MEFKISVGELQTIVSKLANAVRINEDDATGMMRIEASDELVFKTTTGSIHVIITADTGEVIKKGKVLCRFRDVKGYILKFMQLIDDYGTKDFHFIVGNDEGVIKTKTLFPDSKPSYKTLKFDLFNIKEFQPVKPFGEAQLIINSNILKQGIEKVLHCVDPRDIRRALKGLQITVNENKIIFVGTNGVKLAEDTMDISADIKQLSHIFRHDLAAILRAILDDDSQVFMSFESNHICIKSNNMYIVGSLIIGEDYPNYKALFKCANTITFPRSDFTDTVNTVMDVLDPEDNYRLTLNFNGKKLLLKNDRVEAIHDFDVEFASNLDVDINGMFLASILRDFMGERLEVHFTEGNNYLIFKPENDDKHVALLTVVTRR